MKKIVIDIGHGGTDSGAVGNGIKEKDITLKVGLEIRRLLKDYNCDVLLTREGDSYPTLNDRVVLSNNFGADIFVSIHCNSFTNDSACGLETYCYKQSTNNNLANTIHKNILKDSKLYQKNRGVKENSFYVLKNTNCKACLVELAFISNKKDSDLLKRYVPEYARCIVSGIVEYLQLTRKNNVLYRVCTGAFSVRENADRMVKDLQNKGYSPYIIKE